MLIPLVEYVGNLKAPQPYKNHWFMDMEIEAEPVGFDPLTGQSIFWGDGCVLACLVEDRRRSNEDEDEDIPF